MKLKLPNTPIFVMGMTTVLRKYVHMRFENFLPAQGVIQNVFNDYNIVLRESAEAFEIFYVDIQSQWPGDTEESWKFYADGIHPNDTGYDLIAKILYIPITNWFSVFRT